MWLMPSLVINRKKYENRLDLFLICFSFLIASQPKNENLTEKITVRSLHKIRPIKFY